MEQKDKKPREKTNEYMQVSKDTLKDFAQKQKLEESNKEIKKDIIKELHGYPNEYGNDKKELKNIMKFHGVKIKNLGALKRLRGKIMGSKFVGLSFGPYIDVGKDDDMQTLVTHEAHHKLQFDENSPLPNRLSNDFKAIIGFIFISIKVLEEIKKLKASRKEYGSWEAGRYAATHNSMEFEAFLHEGDIQHLQERKPFEYKKYANKEEQQKAMQKMIDDDIQKVENIKDQVLEMVASGNITDEDMKKLTSISEYLLQEAQKIEKIKEAYGQEERDIIDVKHPTYGRSLWLESERNRNKRLSILKNALEKEDDILRVMKRHKEVEVFSSSREREATGLIKIKAKKAYHKELAAKTSEEVMYPQSLVMDVKSMNEKEKKALQVEYRVYKSLGDQLMSDMRIQEFNPHMHIGRAKYDDVGEPILKEGLAINVSVVS